MKLLQLSIETTIIRFYIMMAIVLIAGYTGVWALAFLALPVFLSCLLGVRIGAPVKRQEGRYSDGTKFEHANTVAKSAA